MGWLEPTLWGALGGLVTEVFDYAKAVRRHRRPPWRGAPDATEPLPGPAAHAVASTVRIAVAAGAAGLVGTRGRAPWTAVLVGVGTPLLLERLLAWVPLSRYRGGPDRGTP